MKIWTVDAFTNIPFSGNPAAVTIVENFPSDKNCQHIAAEMNLSETAFVKPLKDANHFHIRWFTPAVEVKLCGHATLAASHILYQQNYTSADQITFESLSGPLKVYKNDAALTLDFPLQQTGPVLETSGFRDILGIPIIAAMQAYDDVIVEVTNETVLRDFQPQFEKIQTLDCRGLILTARGSNQYDFISRFFAPRVGVLEDPVTGSAHCKLADYWEKKLGKKEFLAYQASARGGELKLQIKADRVNITGHAVTILQGDWLANY